MEASARRTTGPNSQTRAAIAAKILRINAAVAFLEGYVAPRLERKRRERDHTGFKEHLTKGLLGLL